MNIFEILVSLFVMYCGIKAIILDTRNEVQGEGKGR